MSSAVGEASTSGATEPFPTVWARSALARFVRGTVLRSVLKPYVWACTRPRVVGLEHLDGLRGPAVFVANHCSHLDTPLILGALPRPLASRLAVGAAADYFFTSPLTGAVSALLFNAFPVHRKGVRRTGTTVAAGLLGQGWSVLLYPEGTRSRDGRLGPFKSGAARLCLETGVPAVPVALHGTLPAIPRGARLPVRNAPPVGVAIGPPIRIGAGESAQSFRDRMRERVSELSGTDADRLDFSRRDPAATNPS